MDSQLHQLLDAVYGSFDGSDVLHAYSQRHGIDSAGVLTVTDDETAHLITSWLSPRLEGKIVIEIGAGIGLLALHVGLLAKRVYAIEANPFWTSTFLTVLLAQKPKHVSYLFGAADEFAGQIHGDVAIFCTHSGVESLHAAAAQFAPVVIDVYGELIAADPDRFDVLARTLRQHA